MTMGKRLVWAAACAGLLAGAGPAWGGVTVFLSPVTSIGGGAVLANPVVDANVGEPITLGVWVSGPVGLTVDALSFDMVETTGILTAQSFIVHEAGSAFDRWFYIRDPNMNSTATKLFTHFNLFGFFDAEGLTGDAVDRGLDANFDPNVATPNGAFLFAVVQFLPTGVGSTDLFFTVGPAGTVYSSESDRGINFGAGDDPVDRTVAYANSALPDATIHVVPEPAAAVLLMLGSAALLRRRSRGSRESGSRLRRGGPATLPLLVMGACLPLLRRRGRQALALIRRKKKNVMSRCRPDALASGRGSGGYAVSARICVASFVLCVMLGPAALAWGEQTPKGFYAPSRRGLFYFEDAGSLPAQEIFVGTGYRMYDAEFTPDGRLFGIAFSGELIEIDPVTGVHRMVAQLGSSVGNLLAIDSNGRAVGAGSSGFVEIDLDDGSLTPIAPMIPGGVATGLAFDRDDRLYSITRDGYFTKYYLDINSASPAGRAIIPDYRANNAHGLTFDDDNRTYFYGVSYNMGYRRLFSSDGPGDSVLTHAVVATRSPLSYALAYNVPEPAALSLLALGALAMTRRRRRQAFIAAKGVAL